MTYRYFAPAEIGAGIQNVSNLCQKYGGRNQNMCKPFCWQNNWNKNYLEQLKHK